MSISGFDVQRTGGSFKDLLSEIAKIMKLKPYLYRDLENTFGELKIILSNTKIDYSSSLELKTNNLILDYEEVYSIIIKSGISVPLKKRIMILKTIQNRIAYLNYMLNFKKNKNWNRRWADRDSLMADNVMWLSQYIYPEKKIIIVGHNFHISKYNEKEEVMGEFLLKKYPNEMYSIGIYAKSGKFLGNFGNEKIMRPADEDRLDIKHIIGALDHEVSFLHIPKIQIVGSEWLHKQIITNDTFVDLSSSNAIILSKNYDGLFLIQNISKPEK